eukprot:scaffold6880_cov110-Isochrysis_galbana.AAC.14
MAGRGTDGEERVVGGNFTSEFRGGKQKDEQDELRAVAAQHSYPQPPRSHLLFILGIGIEARVLNVAAPETLRPPLRSRSGGRRR